jgi:TolB-like protein
MKYPKVRQCVQKFIQNLHRYLRAWFQCGNIFLIFSLILLHASGCAYVVGKKDRYLPGDTRQVGIPMFQNQSPEVGIELDFTNALIQEIAKSRMVEVIPSESSEFVLEGNIVSIKYNAAATSDQLPHLPSGTVLATIYRITADVHLQLRNKAKNQVIWSQNFSGERTYTAPQVATAGINSVNPLYNLSARRQNIRVIAADIMAEARDRLTEKF